MTFTAETIQDRTEYVAEFVGFRRTVEGNAVTLTRKTNRVTFKVPAEGAETLELQCKQGRRKPFTFTAQTPRDFDVQVENVLAY